jgi:hypothetical protein
MVRISSLLGVCVLAFAMPVFAQSTSFIDATGGYAFVRDQRIEQNLQGWFAAATLHVTSWLGVTGEVDGTYAVQPIFGTDLKLGVRAVMAGPRISIRRAARIAPFAHVLFGSARATAGILGQSSEVADTAVQTGGGVEVRLASRVGLHVGADYRRVLADEPGDQFRFTASLVVPLVRR